LAAVSSPSPAQAEEPPTYDSQWSWDEEPELQPLEPTDARSSRATGRIVAGSIMAGAGIIGIGAFTYATLRVSEINDEPQYVAYASGFTGDENICSQAGAGRSSSVPGSGSPAEIDDLCREARRLEMVEAFALPTGISLLGLGSYLLVTGIIDRSRGSDRAWTLTPQLGPGQSGLQLSGSF
jgi:hypothetical protein